ARPQVEVDVRAPRAEEEAVRAEAGQLHLLRPAAALREQV
ncbi:MAG: hypothetical protein AVDCRST_MAG38-1771, partial [uncultured Solirubrobacteraceae bacterium]